MLYKNHIFQRMGKIFCVEFQRVPLKFHTKYLTHTLKELDFALRFKSSLVFLKRPPDPLKEVPLPPMDGILPAEEPEIPPSQGSGGLRLYEEVREFIRKARASSALGLNGISFKLYTNCTTVLEQQLVCLLERDWGKYTAHNRSA